MRRWGVVVALIGMAGAAGVVAAHEGEGRPHGEMPPAMQAIKDKYQASKEQLRNDCRQKMQALEQAEHAEMQTAMKAEHEARVQDIEQKYQQHMQEMNKHWDEHMQEKQQTH